MVLTIVVIIATNQLHFVKVSILLIQFKNLDVKEVQSDILTEIFSIFDF